MPATMQRRRLVLDNLSFSPLKLSPVLWLDASQIPTATYGTDALIGSGNLTGSTDAQGQTWSAGTATSPVRGASGLTGVASTVTRSVVATGQSNGILALTLATVDSAGGQWLYFRYSSETNWWRVGNNAGTYTLQSCIAGTVTSVTTFTGTPTNGDVLLVALNGNEIGLYLNGTYKAATNSSSLASNTSHGVGVDSSTTAVLTNFAHRLNGNGDPLYSWPNLSGNGYAAVQATPLAYPTYVASGLNGLPVLRGDGSYTYLAAPAGVMDSLSALSWAAVLIPRGTKLGVCFDKGASSAMSLENVSGLMPNAYINASGTQRQRR